MSTIKVHTYLGDYYGCGHIRSIIPSALINSMHFLDNNIEFTNNTTFISDNGFYKHYSIVKFQRACTENHLKMIKQLKNQFQEENKKVIYEIDDNFFEIPKTNFAHDFYTEKKEIIEEILKIVDGIITSTDYMEKTLLKYNNNIKVIENRLSPYLWPNKQKYCGKFNKRILWAGSQNHFSINGHGGDFSKDLLDYIKKSKDTTFVFVGAIPNEIRSLKNIEFHMWKNFYDYPSFVKDLNCTIGIAPLEQNEFNRCKSNIKALEFNALGIPGAYSNIEPYHNMSYCDDDIISSIEELKKPSNREKAFYNDYKKLETNMFWDKISLLDFINKHLYFVNSKVQ